MLKFLTEKKLSVVNALTVALVCARLSEGNYVHGLLTYVAGTIIAVSLDHIAERDAA